jgi:hypothetical protein
LRDICRQNQFDSSRGEERQCRVIEKLFKAIDKVGKYGVVVDSEEDRRRVIVKLKERGGVISQR